MPLLQDLGAGSAVVMGKISLNQFKSICRVGFTNELRHLLFIFYLLSFISLLSNTLVRDEPLNS